MKIIIIALMALTSISAFADKGGFVKIESPKINELRISNKSDFNGVCINLGYINGIVAESVRISKNELMTNFDHRYSKGLIFTYQPKEPNTLIINENGEVSGLLSRKSKYITSIACWL